MFIESYTKNSLSGKGKDDLIKIILDAQTLRRTQIKKVKAKIAEYEKLSESATEKKKKSYQSQASRWRRDLKILNGEDPESTSRADKATTAADFHARITESIASLASLQKNRAKECPSDDLKALKWYRDGDKIKALQSRISVNRKHWEALPENKGKKHPSRT